MQISTVKGMHIDAVYACVPDNEIDNYETLTALFGDDAKNILKATGIKKRCIARPGTSSLDLCIDCAEKMMADMRIDTEEIGGVVFVTFTPERLLPFNAAAVQDRLGLNKGIPCFDMGLACSGYAYGMWVSSMMATSMNKKVLLLDGDIQSAFLSGQDKSTVPVMADAGSATLLSYDPLDDVEWKFSFYTDGSGRDQLTIPVGGSGKPIQSSDLELVEYETGSKRRAIDIYMDGFGIFKFVAQDASKLINQFIEECDIRESIDVFVPHQANMYMIKQLARKLKVSWDKTWKSGDEVGNSASATVPVTIAKNAPTELKKDMNRALIAGFGGGLSASVGYVTFDKKAKYGFYRY